MNNFDINSALKKKYSELSKEEQQYVYSTYMRYLVRKEVAEQNNVLSTYFSNGSSNGKVISQYFNYFNSSFANCNLISQLNYDEVNTDYLLDISEDSFNRLITNAGSFSRQVALICYSRRNHERIPNRVTYEALVAYADMQYRTIQNIESKKFRSIYDAMTDAAKVTRYEFEKKFGHRINDTRALSECKDYKRPGKKTAMVWNNMNEHFVERIEKMEGEQSLEFLLKHFAPTLKMRTELEANAESSRRKAKSSMKSRFETILDAMHIKEGDQLTFDAYANIADYDEIKSPTYVEGEISDAVKSVARRYLTSQKLDVTPSSSQQKEIK